MMTVVDDDNDDVMMIIMANDLQSELLSIITTYPILSHFDIAAL